MPPNPGHKVRSASSDAFLSWPEANNATHLCDQGFSQIEARQTLLGRTRMLAGSADRRREIIINPNAGEIMTAAST
jgi:hypothetical protein